MTDAQKRIVKKLTFLKRNSISTALLSIAVMTAALGASYPFLDQGQWVLLILFVEYLFIGAFQTISNHFDLQYQQTERDHFSETFFKESSGSKKNPEKVTELSSVNYDSPSAIQARANGEMFESKMMNEA